MKRFLLYAMMTAGVLASCSQGENDGLPQDDSVNGGTDAAPILLSAVAPSASEVPCKRQFRLQRWVVLCGERNLLFGLLFLSKSLVRFF